MPTNLLLAYYVETTFAALKIFIKIFDLCRLQVTQNIAHIFYRHN